MKDLDTGAIMQEQMKLQREEIMKEMHDLETVHLYYTKDKYKSLSAQLRLMVQLQRRCTQAILRSVMDKNIE